MSVYIGACRNMPRRRLYHKTMTIRDLATDGQAAKNTVIAEMVAAGTEPGFKIIKDGLSQTEAMALERGIEDAGIRFE